MIDHWERYTREQIRANPDVLFVFGDNLVEQGLGGQAAAARGEPNAVGIPTKRAPHSGDDAFLSDADLDEVRPIIQERFRKLKAHMDEGKRVVFPADGIGTGLARLSEKAPAIEAFIATCYRHLLRRAYELDRPFPGANIPHI